MTKIVYILCVLFLVFNYANGSCTKAQDCITDFDQEDCEEGFYLVQNEGVDGCCPKCKKALGLNDMCGGILGSCGPGLKCEGRLCVTDEDHLCWHTWYDNSTIKYKQKCDSNGKFAPVQCKGDDIVGRCFCSDENGKRIFGIAWASDAEDMTCACSRKRAELEKSGRNDVTLHCSANGNYEELQCDSKVCWCVNKKTGISESNVVLEDLVSQLPCYNSDTYGSQYLRYCESKAHATTEIKNLLSIHGTTQVTMETVFCDYDGTFGVYQIALGVAYCSWRDSSRIGSWQSEAGANLADVDCNCARDTKYFEEANKAMSMSCLGNGNYMPLQQLNGQQYCVDRDGFPITELYPLGQVLIC